MNDYADRLHKAIPGGAHTYSRGDDQYPSNAPPILARGEGAHVWDADGRRFLSLALMNGSRHTAFQEQQLHALLELAAQDHALIQVEKEGARVGHVAFKNLVRQFKFHELPR